MAKESIFVDLLVSGTVLMENIFMQLSHLQHSLFLRQDFLFFDFYIHFDRKWVVYKTCLLSSFWYPSITDVLTFSSEIDRWAIQSWWACGRELIGQSRRFLMISILWGTLRLARAGVMVLCDGAVSRLLVCIYLFNRMLLHSVVFVLVTRLNTVIFVL